MTSYNFLGLPLGKEYDEQGTGVLIYALCVEEFGRVTQVACQPLHTVCLFHCLFSSLFPRKNGHFFARHPFQSYVECLIGGSRETFALCEPSYFRWAIS